MKVSITLIDIILFMSIFVPYYLFIRAGKRSEKQKLKVYKQLAASEGLQPDLQERWDNNYIGIDSSQKRLIFIRTLLEKETVQVILLNKIHDCSLVKHYKRVRKGDSKEDVLSQLGIELRYQNTKMPSELLIFYDIATTSGENHELPRAEKWLERIREQLGPKKQELLVA